MVTSTSTSISKSGVLKNGLAFRPFFWLGAVFCLIALEPGGFFGKEKFY